MLVMNTNVRFNDLGNGTVRDNTTGLIWLNAEPTGNGGPGVEVASNSVSGYVWGENVGWISLSCENTSSCGTVDYGVSNDGSGNLSGYAWGQNIGWISFSCENTASCITVGYGVTIDGGTGMFSGYAWGENVGWISFRATGSDLYGVVTSWSQGECRYDSNDDGDVDGLDLAAFTSGYTTGLYNASHLQFFVTEFGRADCLD